MALDLIQAWHYLSDDGTGDSVWCTNLDGTNPGPLVGDLLAPQDLAADTTGNGIYRPDGNAG